MTTSVIFRDLRCPNSQTTDAKVTPKRTSMSSGRARIGFTSTSKCIRDTLHPHKLVFNPHPISFHSIYPVNRLPSCFQRIDNRPFTTSSPFLDPSSSDSTTRPHVPWPTHSTNPSPYEIFALPHHATAKEIKSRYFQLVKQYHPDHSPHQPPTTTSTDRFRKVVEAYKIPSKRADYDAQHPPAHPQQRHSEFRQPWSGSRLSRRRTDPKGPPPSGGWSFGRTGRGSGSLNSQFPQGQGGDADNAHFNYERHYRRNLEQEMKIKRRMDELAAHRMAFERQKEQSRQSMRMGMAFTGGLFFLVVLAARALAPS